MVKKISLILMVTIFICIGIAETSYADESLPFSVSPILPSNQDANIESVFSISTDENSLNQELEFVIENRTNEKQVIDAKVVNAYTSPDGIAQYIENEQENSKIIDEKYKMTNYLSFENNNKIILEANERKVVKTDLNIDDVEGVILGGVTFQAILENEKTEEKEGSSFQLDNEIKRLIGIKLDFGTVNETELIIDDPYIEVMPAYYAIRLPVTLDAPLFKGINIEYDVLLKDEVLFSNSKEMEFAPMTKTNLALPWQHEEIERGETYTIKGKITFKKLKGETQAIEFERDFKYTLDENKNNIGDVLKAPFEKGGFPYWALLLLIIPLILYFLWRKKKYVLFSNRTEVLKVIDENHEFYEKIQPIKGAINKDDAKYADYYKKSRHNEKGIVYEYLESKEI